MPPKGKEKKKEEEKEKEQEEGDQQPATKKARVDAKNPRRPDYGTAYIHLYIFLSLSRVKKHISKLHKNNIIHTRVRARAHTHTHATYIYI